MQRADFRARTIHLLCSDTTIPDASLFLRQWEGKVSSGRLTRLWTDLP